MNILLIGPIPPPIGGISVSFKVLFDLLSRRKDIEIEILDFNEIRNRTGYSLNSLFTLLKVVISKTRLTDVVTVYCASTALPTLGLALLIISRVMQKPLIIRKAAGLDYLAIGSFKGLIAHFVINHSELFLAETKALVQLAKKRGIARVKWYPTNRPLYDNGFLPEISDRICRHFVFVGQVRGHKGIREIIQAAERFDEKIHVDIYGPVFDDIEQNIFDNCQRISYRGILSPDKVISTLKQYDLSLLPSKHGPEGYPGAILEAYSAGIPLITTRCGGIPEIVDETSGIFVEPGDPDALFHAMKLVVENRSLYHRLLKGVRRKRNEFDSTVWADRFVDYCRQTVDSYNQ
jgi:glycosyltransferase involved in cell wall biosynthesis